MLFRQATEHSLTLDTPAKVNLFLEVGDRRADGFHNIRSLFQAVSLYDSIRFSSQPDRGVSLRPVRGIKVPAGEDNLIGRAYRLMRRQFDLKVGLRVELTKRIPVAAGLGGGSSNAAATLLACNRLFDLGLGAAELADLGLQIGSDVPFFFSSGQALVSGRGEIVKNVELPTDYRLVLVTPAVAVSTAASYSALNSSLTGWTNSGSIGVCRTVDDLVAWLHLTGNAFESMQIRSLPVLKRIREELNRHGALLARMTGSGPTVFGVFRQAPRNEVSKWFSRGDWRVQVVRPITLAGQQAL